MSPAPSVGVITVRSKEQKTLFAGGKAEALIWTGAQWRPVKAAIKVDSQQKRVEVRILQADLAGLPQPTGAIIVEDPIKGWGGFASVTNIA